VHYVGHYKKFSLIPAQVVCIQLLIERSRVWQIICEYTRIYFGQLSQYSDCATRWKIQQPCMNSRQEQESAVNWEGCGVIHYKLNMRFGGLRKAIHKAKLRAEIWTQSLMRENCKPNTTKCGSTSVFGQSLRYGASKQFRLCDVQCYISIVKPTWCTFYSIY
jgi:hypothetical protein